MISEQLKSLGFSSKETNIYLALADAGKSTAYHLSKVTKISRATIYFVLENLEKKGLVSREHRSNTTFYTINNPSSLVRLFEAEKKELDKKLLLAKEISQDLTQNIKNPHFHIPKLKFYEGKENVENMLYDNIEIWRKSLEKYDFTWWGYEDANLTTEYKAWFDWYWKRSYPREIEKIRIFSNNPFSKKLSKLFNETILRPVPKEYDFNTTIWILGDYIIMLMSRHKPHYAVQIWDPIFARNLAMIFQWLWTDKTE